MGEPWLLITISTAGTTGTLRVQVWRKLRSLGALYLQPSGCLLPARPAVVREVVRLTERVRHQGGTARVLRIALLEPEQRAQVIAELNAARDGEYREVLERLPTLFAELRSERARGRASYVEVEENEADLHRFQTWMAKIAARDYFKAPTGASARDALAAAAAELAAFEAEALQAEAPPEDSTGSDRPSQPVGQRLRIVDGPRAGNGSE